MAHGFMAPPTKPSLVKQPLENRAPKSLTRQEIMAILPPPEQYLSANIVRISSDLVVKYGTRVQMGEARSMKFATAIPGLRVPRVHDVWVIEQDVEYYPDSDITKCTYILMDWIHGDRLGDIWQLLDETRRGLTVNQIHGMLKALHGKTLDMPGPIGGGRSRGFWFTDQGATFASQREMELWFDSRLKVCQEYRKAPVDQFSFIGHLHPLVMCHLDIHTYNIIVDNQDRLWLLDWESAGAYPDYFEGLFMIHDRLNPDFTAALQSLLKSPESEDMIARVESIGFAVTTGRRLQPGQNCDADS